MTVREQLDRKIGEFESLAATAYAQHVRTDISPRVSLARVRLLGRDAHKIFLEIKALHEQLDTRNP
jgi:hypothetical protein